MLIERNDIYELITNQSFKTINLGDQKDKIIKIFGTPLFIEPEKKASPEIISYGCVDFYFRKNILNGFSFNSDKLKYFDNIKYDNILKKEIKDILLQKKIKFVIENEVLDCNIIANNENFIVRDIIHLNFYKQILVSWGMLKA